MSQSIRNMILVVNDEESFVTFVEKLIYEMQRIWRSKPGMDLYSVIGMCAKIEDLIYNNSLREYGMSLSSNCWSRSECLLYYQDSCVKVVQSLETKELNWRKLFEDNQNSVRTVFNILLKDDDGNKKYKFDPLAIDKQKKMRMKRKLGDGETNQRKKSNNNRNLQSNSIIITTKKKEIKSLKSKKSTDTFNIFNNSLMDTNLMSVDQVQTDEQMLENVGLDEFGFDFDEDDILGDVN